MGGFLYATADRDPLVIKGTSYPYSYPYFIGISQSLIKSRIFPCACPAFTSVLVYSLLVATREDNFSQQSPHTAAVPPNSTSQTDKQSHSSHNCLGNSFYRTSALHIIVQESRYHCVYKVDNDITFPQSVPTPKGHDY